MTLQPPQPHPQRCGICNKKECFYHPDFRARWMKMGVWVWSLNDHKKIWDFTAEYGCASFPHSTQQEAPR